VTAYLASAGFGPTAFTLTLGQDTFHGFGDDTFNAPLAVFDPDDNISPALKKAVDFPTANSLTPGYSDQGPVRSAGLPGYGGGNGALSRVGCGDPTHREQARSDRPGAKGLLRTG